MFKWIESNLPRVFWTFFIGFGLGALWAFALAVAVLRGTGCL